MTAMRTNILIVSFFCLTLTVFAQKSSDKAKAILDNASQLFEQSEGVKLSFTVAPDTPSGGMFEPQKGTAYVKGNRFKLDLPYSTTWFDGATQWVLIKDANEVNISNPTPQEIISISPMGLLNMYKTDYLLKEPVKRNYNGKPIIDIELTPTDKFQEFETLTISLDPVSQRVVMVRFVARDGSKNKLTVSDYNSNYKYRDDMFSFDKKKHPGVEVIDLR